MRLLIFRPAFWLALWIFVLALPVPTEAQDRGTRIIRDAEIENTIRAYATPLLQAAGLSPLGVKFYLIEDRRLNAFVTGGQRMFLHTGLLMRATGPLQVQGVIAHEIGHIVGGHIVGRIEEIRNAQIKSLVSVLLGIGLAVGTGQPAAAPAVIRGGQDLAIKGLLSFTRGQEQAADQTAVRLLKSIQQPPSGLLQFMRFLEEQEILLGASQDPYLRTHPLTRERIDFMENALQRSRFAGAETPEDLIVRHQRLRAKLIGFLDDPGRVARQYPESDQSLPARYARSISHFLLGDLNQALPLIDGLLAEKPDDPFFHELKGQMLFQNGRLDEALPEYEEAVRLLPSAPQLQLSLAHLQVELNQRALDEQALEHLKWVLQEEPRNAMAWRLASTAYGRLGNKGMTTLALAEAAFSRGVYGEAHQRASRAQQLLSEYSPSWLRAQDLANEAKRLESKQKKRN